jgi:hypothetical protein
MLVLLHDFMKYSVFIEAPSFGPWSSVLPTSICFIPSMILFFLESGHSAPRPQRPAFFPHLATPQACHPPICGGGSLSPRNGPWALFSSSSNPFPCRPAGLSSSMKDPSFTSFSEEEVFDFFIPVAAGRSHRLISSGKGLHHCDLLVQVYSISQNCFRAWLDQKLLTCGSDLACHLAPHISHSLLLARLYANLSSSPVKEPVIPKST